MLVIACGGPYRASHELGCGEAVHACGASLPGPDRIWRRGFALSSAILYLAIVAIWAVVLVPRWLRSRHTLFRTLETEGASPVGSTAEIAPPGSAEEQREAADGGEAAGAGLTPRRDRDPESPEQDPNPPERVGEHSAASPAERQALILTARRRALITLLMLTAGAVGIALAHLAAWWVIAPPVVMLAGLLLVLREAARMDAERARTARARFARSSAQRSEPLRGEHSPDTLPAEALPGAPTEPGDHSRAGETAGTDPAEADEPVPSPEPAAKVIDLSARIEDQLYDQYADARERAVGD